MQSFIVEESLNSAKIFWLDQERLRAELYRIAQEVGRGDEKGKVKVCLQNQYTVYGSPRDYGS